LFLPQKLPDESGGRIFSEYQGGIREVDEDRVFAWREGDDRGNDADESEQGIFAPLLVTFHEQDIQSRFLKLDALRFTRRVVLLGLRRHDSLRLLSRLAHDAASTDFFRTKDGREIGERDWLFCGSTPPALPHVRIDTPDTLLRDLEVLVAPDDGLCDSDGALRIDWGDMFAEWLPVIHLDIARIDSGLSDLARAPYGKALSHADRWIAASGQGALFNGRLSHLLTDVPERVDLFARSRNCRGRAEWFVYENYDARYTDFMLWGRGIGSESGYEALLRKWSESGYDFTFPFSKPQLRLAMEAARRKMGSGDKSPAGYTGRSPVVFA
jgi:hypothetical protein